MTRVTPRADAPGAEPAANGIGLDAKRPRAAAPNDRVPPWRRALLRRRAAAALLDISPSALDRLSAAGACPRALKAGRAVVWRRHDLLLWVRWGMPDRTVFEARLRAAEAGRR